MDREAAIKEQADLLELAHDAILVRDLDGRITYWNHGAEETYGWSRDEAIGNVVHTFLHTHFPESHEQAHEALLSTGKWEGELVQTAKSGAQIVVESRQALRRNAQGEPAAALEINRVTRDITERKRAQEALKESQARFQSLFDELPTPVWEEDFSAVKAAIDDLRRSGVSDFKSYFERNPEAVKAFAPLIKFNNMNRAAMAMHRIDNKEQFIGDAHTVFETDSYTSLARELALIGEGKTRFDLEREVQTPDGERKSIIIHWAVAGGHESTLSRVLVTVMDITELKRAQETVNAFFASSPVGMSIVDRNLRFVRINDVMASINGPRVEDTLGRTIYEVVPELTPFLEPLCQRIMTTGVPALNMQVSGQTPREPGVERHWLASYFPIKDTGGASVYLGTTVVEITQLKRTEEALRASEAKERERADELQTLMDSVPAIVWTARDPECRVITGNRAASEFLRMPIDSNQSKTGLEESRVRHFTVCKDGAEIPPQELPVQVAARGAQVRNYEEDIVFDDGTTRHLIGNASPLWDARGNVRGAIAAFTDITERRQMEDALRASEARFSTVFHASLLSIALVRLSDNRIVDVNPACLDATGLTREEAIGRTPYELNLWTNPEERKQVATILRNQHRIRDYELHIRKKSGEVAAMLFTAELVDIAGEPCMLSMAVDITERKQMEEALSRAQKLEALGTLAGGIAHDFNNLLLAIAGNAKLATDDLPPDHPAQESLAEITKATTRATNLARQILAFGNPQEQKHEVVQIQLAVEEALKLLRVTIPPSIKLETRFAKPVPDISYNATLIHQAVVNLVTNAVQAIGDHPGQIEVSVDAIHVDANKVRSVPGLREGDYVRLTVSDDGSGMDQVILQRIFDPFFTTKPVGQGTGLGLSVVHGIMQSHGGAVTVSSQPGQGATFQLYFPIAENSAERVQAERRDRAPGSSKRVLFIDDEDALVFLVTRVLTRLGHAVTGYTDSIQALAVFQSQPNAFDVVVTDLSMPGMNGFDLVRALLAVRPDVPIVMTTGYVRAEDQELMERLGIRALILKPNTIDEIGHVLDRLFQDID